VNEFSKRKAVHAVAFSEDGNRYMKKKFIREGYISLEKKNKTLIPEEHKGYDNWMFKDYSDK
jgi:hypothetical protein